MKKIYKYPIDISVRYKVVMPEGAKVLCAQAQGLDICLWALIDLDATANETRSFSVYGTGHAIDSPYEMVHIDTVQFPKERIVLHVFEELT